MPRRRYRYCAQSRHRTWHPLARSVSLALTALLPAAQATDSIFDLGTLGGSYSEALGVSADGSVVVGSAYLAGNTA